jgi:hypothetical protein
MEFLDGNNNFDIDFMDEGSNSVVRMEDDDPETVKEIFLLKNSDLDYEIDNSLLDIWRKNIPPLINFNEKTENNKKSKNEFPIKPLVFKIRYNQNYFNYKNLKSIDIYSGKSTHISNDKKENISQKKGNQFKNLKKIFAKTKEENKSPNDTFDQSKENKKRSSIFENVDTNFIDDSKKSAKNYNINKKRHGFVSSISMLNKNIDMPVDKDPRFNIRSIIEDNEFEVKLN